MKQIANKERAQLIAMIIVATGVILMIVWGFISSRKKAHSEIGPPRIFSGLVIDQNGEPVSDAELIVSTSELVANQIIAGDLAVDRQTQKKFSVYTGRNGTFLLILSWPYHVINIEDIKKEGYDWVIDWAWTLPDVNPKGDGDNRIYTLSGKLVKCNVYAPDTNRPAIFPLHRKDDPAPATRPSRGGKDIFCNGTERVNELVELHVPSAGPNAPKTNLDIEARIREFNQKRLENKAQP